ncbi:hypothetical protein AB0D99_12235 [Streptomyces sp. NPDC047971]|uniref:hypothetical protein n=1 Tax=Streptomyces sp. NPDC047971 TaxID=3154499 RepID=UPI0033C4CAB8
MDWQCAKCEKPITFADGESMGDATRRHSREAVHAWTGARRTPAAGVEQTWLTPSERADRSERASASRHNSVGLSESSAARPGKGTVRKTGKTERRAPSGTLLYLVAGLVMAVAIVALPVSWGEEPDRSPSGSSTGLAPEPESSPSESSTASITEPEAGSTTTTPPPLDSSSPAYTPEPGNAPNTEGGRPRDSRDNDSYYDGIYDNDDEWHRDHGNPDEYYDGDYDNDDDYHRKYGRD